MALVLKRKECGIQITEEIWEDVLSDDRVQEVIALFEAERSQAAIPEEEWPQRIPALLQPNSSTIPNIAAEPDRTSTTH